MAAIAKFRSFPTTNFFTNGLLDDFFNRSISDRVGTDALMSQPAVNIVETNADFRIELAAPGFEKQDFVLNVEDNHLTVKAERKEETKREDEQFTRREFRYETFQRTFKLPETVNQESVNAVYQSGILKITLPKKEEAKAIVKTIAIS